MRRYLCHAVTHADSGTPECLGGLLILLPVHCGVLAATFMGLALHVLLR